MGARADDVALVALEARLGYSFKDRALLHEALTHGSALDGRARAKSYERLEFLGDRVLGLTIADRLYADYPEEGESGLAVRLNALVNRQACARAARRADLGAAAVLSPSEAEQGGRGKDAILADLCESLIAALYLDGGREASNGFIERFWAGEFEAVKKAPRDPKTALQEWAAARKRTLHYELIERAGPEHAPRFTVEARVDGFDATRGEGGSKRDAERAAAAAFMQELGADV